MDANNMSHSVIEKESYISREAAIEAVESSLSFHSYAGGIAANTIAKLPAADVRPVVKGKWILKDDGRAHCSMCDTPGNSYVWNFCPKCGAKMGEL